MIKQKMVVGISSRALFSLDDSHAIFETHRKEAFCRYQIEHEDEILAHLRDIFLQLTFISVCYNSIVTDQPHHMVCRG